MVLAHHLIHFRIVLPLLGKVSDEQSVAVVVSKLIIHHGVDPLEGNARGAVPSTLQLLVEHQRHGEVLVGRVHNVELGIVLGVLRLRLNRRKSPESRLVFHRNDLVNQLFVGGPKS